MNTDNQQRETKEGLVYKIRWTQTLGGVGARFPESNPFSAKDDIEAEKIARSLDKKETGNSGYLGYMHADLYRQDEDKRFWNPIKALY